MGKFLTVPVDLRKHSQAVIATKCRRDQQFEAMTAYRTLNLRTRYDALEICQTATGARKVKGPAHMRGLLLGSGTGCSTLLHGRSPLFDRIVDVGIRSSPPLSRGTSVEADEVIHLENRYPSRRTSPFLRLRPLFPYEVVALLHERHQ